MQSSSQIVTTNTPTPSCLQAGCPSCHPTNSVRIQNRLRHASYVLRTVWHVTRAVNYKYKNWQPQSTSVLAEDVHVEDITVLHTLHNADWNVNERIFMQYKQPIVGQRNDSIGSRSTEVLDTLTVQLVERYSQSFLVALYRLLRINFTDKYWF